MNWVWYVAIWLLCGFIPSASLCWYGTRGKTVTVKDLFFIIGLTILGLVGALFILNVVWQDLCDKVIWDRRKPDPNVTPDLGP